MMHRITLVVSAIILLSACQKSEKTAQENQQQMTQMAETVSYPESLNLLTAAHHLEKFHQEEVISFDLALTFRGKLRLEGTIYARTNSTAVLVDKLDGTQLLFDGKEVYISPDSAKQNGARFDALTWSYFALAPFKFKDEGTNWNDHGPLPLDSAQKDYASLKLTFGDNVGDAPDDWYIIFKDSETNLLKAMAYIVTFGDTPQAQAEKSPHAISYSDYREIAGVPFATSWGFFDWNAQEGLGVQLGEARLSNIHFLSEPDSLFTKKADARLVPLK